LLYEQTKAARHPQSASAADATIVSYQEELRAIAARLHSLAKGLISYPIEQAPMRAQLMMAHIRVSAALRSVQDAERSLELATHTTEMLIPFDTAA
jgi:hypothetical protein